MIPQCAHDRAYGHGCFQSLAADVADNHEDIAFSIWKYAEEISAHLFGWCVGTLNPEARHIHCRGHQLFLNFACCLELCTQRTRLLPCLPSPPEEHDGDGNIQEHDAERPKIQGIRTQGEVNGVAEGSEQDDHLKEALGRGDGAIASGTKDLTNANWKKNTVKGWNASNNDDLAEMQERRRLHEICLGDFGQPDNDPDDVPQDA